jgi:hypothetical protein
MKLSEYVQQLEIAYSTLISELRRRDQQDLAFEYTPRRPNHILPRERQYNRPPIIPTQYEPDISRSPIECKEKLVLFAAFEATYQDSKSPISPDMVPLILDTGASISISPYRSDFVSTIRPVQKVQIKGIASGLTVEGIGDLQYKIINDAGEEQTLFLKNSLYVPQCIVRLICLRQIGAETNNPLDGFNALSENPILTINGKPTTIAYDSISQLPLLYTTPGITSYERYMCNMCSTSGDFTQPSNLINLTKQQRLKLYLHEACAHEGFTNLNKWIREGRFPGVNPALAKEPDPLCST